MRVSNRDRILEGVVQIIERDGVTAVTFDAVAAETGLTRGGIIYHFASREDLLVATHRHLAQKWAMELDALVPSAHTQADRYAAYVRSSSREATRAELLLMLESGRDEILGAIWAEVINQWAPPVPDDDDPAAMRRFLARLAADGLWAHQAAAGKSLSPKVKARVSKAILGLLEE